MIEWMTGKALPYLIAAAVMLAAAALFAIGMGRINAMVETARAEAIAARDAHWMAQISEANAKVDKAAASLARLAMQKDAELAAAERSMREQQTTLEAENAALPGADDCGLSHDRVRLLNRR